MNTTLKHFLIFLFAEISFAANAKIYDYIVVGGGTAGCVVAARLSEDPSKSVLLLEAGGEPGLASKIITLFPLEIASRQNFHYFADSESDGIQGTISSYWPRGKMLGGTSSLNGGIFIRANKRNFEEWVNQGAEGWSWDEVLPFYKKTENYLISTTAPELHSKEGPIPITTSGEGDPVFHSFLKNSKELLGLTYRDPSDGNQTGVCYNPLNIQNRIRRTSYTNYLKPVISKRKNLVVETNAFVEKLVFDGNKRVKSVVYSKNWKQVTVSVNKEVILSAGVINTPQLLMLSGVGPKSHLNSLGIDVVMDLPVGRNLKDHFGVIDIHEFKLLNLINTPFFGCTSAFYNSVFDKNEFDPDIQLMLFVYTHFYISVTVLSKPESKGHIELKSKNPNDKPKIEPMHLTVENDVNRLADGVRKASEIFNRMKLSQSDADECQHLNTSSIDYWKCFVKAKGGTFFHPVGTCKMGSQQSIDSVVDNKLKVIGLQNVRIADASVFPDQISGNPVATILMIAERVVDFIKNNQ